MPLSEQDLLRLSAARGRIRVPQLTCWDLADNQQHHLAIWVKSLIWYGSQVDYKWSKNIFRSSCNCSQTGILLSDYKKIKSLYWLYLSLSQITKFIINKGRNRNLYKKQKQNFNLKSEWNHLYLPTSAACSC